jgi:hypothetical protein
MARWASRAKVAVIWEYLLDEATYKCHLGRLQANLGATTGAALRQQAIYSPASNTHVSLSSGSSARPLSQTLAVSCSIDHQVVLVLVPEECIGSFVGYRRRAQETIPISEALRLYNRALQKVEQLYSQNWVVEVHGLAFENQAVLQHDPPLVDAILLQAPDILQQVFRVLTEGTRSNPPTSQAFVCFTSIEPSLPPYLTGITGLTADRDVAYSAKNAPWGILGCYPRLFRDINRLSTP